MGGGADAPGVTGRSGEGHLPAGEGAVGTDRERQVLRLAADGRTGAEIASTLNLAEGTVRNYLSEAISKMGASNRVEAAKIAREKGWLY